MASSTYEVVNGRSEIEQRRYTNLKNAEDEHGQYLPLTCDHFIQTCTYILSCDKKNLTLVVILCAMKLVSESVVNLSQSSFETLSCTCFMKLYYLTTHVRSCIYLSQNWIAVFSDELFEEQRTNRFLRWLFLWCYYV